MKDATSQATLTTPPQERPAWTVEFEHLGRTFSIYKRHRTRSAPYQFCIVRLGRRTRHSLESNDAKTAVDRAKQLIDRITADKWADVDRVKCRRPGRVTLAQLFKVYREVAQVSAVSLRNNTGSMRWLIETAVGEIDPAVWPLTQLTGELVGQFQRRMVARYQANAAPSDPEQREARERALRSSRSVIKQARSLFARRTALVDRYREHGIILPACIDEFMTARVEGRVTKREYHAPDDVIVEKAFAEIGRFALNDPDIFIAFWLAVGAGLRRGEIQQMQWEYVIERNGDTWISGGIGKDGARIEVPMQLRAVEELRIVRRPSGRCLQETSLEWARRLNAWMRGLGWNTQKKIHELRAYVGSLIYRKDPMAAMAFLRHKTIRQTEQAYVRYGRSDLPPQVL